MLLEKNADVNKVSGYGNAALNWGKVKYNFQVNSNQLFIIALEMGHEKLVNLLLEYNADYNAVNGEGNSALIVGK